MTDKTKIFKNYKSGISPQEAYDLAGKAASDPGMRRDGTILIGDTIDDLSLLYLAAQHIGLKITGSKLNGEAQPITKEIKTKKAKEWKTFLHEQKIESLRFLLSDKGLFGKKKEQPEASASAMHKLDQLIGLKEVKTQIQDIGHLMKNRKDRERAGLPAITMSQHLVFTGNPGTGKTTVARLIGEAFRELGVLKKGHFIEIDGRGLIADYVGQTAAKATEIITEALDGVLFIDEAYALVPEDPVRDFGPEAVATLIKMMEDHHERLVVILAGYEDEMERFLNCNPGLKSRFKTKIDFPDYDSEELDQIFAKLCNDNDYILTKEAQQKAKELFTEMDKKKGNQFGNGRTVRNAFDKCILNQARRLAAISKPSHEDLKTFLQADIADIKDVEE